MEQAQIDAGIDLVGFLPAKIGVGQPQARTRLYRIGITLTLLEIQEDVEVCGLKEDEWQKFERNVVYDAFLVKRKAILKGRSTNWKNRKHQLSRSTSDLKNKSKVIFEKKMEEANQTLQR